MMPGDAAWDDDMDMGDSLEDEVVVEAWLLLSISRRVYMLDLGVVGKE